MRPTLQDVAKVAGCSQATVSRALSSNPRISEATRTRVIEAAKALNYQQRYSKTLGAHSKPVHHDVGVIVPTTHTAHYYYDMSLLYQLLSDHGYGVVVGCHNYDAGQDVQLIKNLVERGVAGIVHTPCTSAGALPTVRANTNHEIPIVELSWCDQETVDIVYVDEESALSEIISHLVKNGHQSIALVTGRENHHHVRLRTRHFNVTVATAGLEPSKCPVYYGPASAQWGSDAIAAIREATPRTTAVIVANTPAIVGVVSGILSLGLSVPHDIAVASLSDELWHAIADPPITAYEFPLREIGLMAGQLLLNRITGGPDLDRSMVGFSGRLMVRDSTANGLPRAGGRPTSTAGGFDQGDAKPPKSDLRVRR